jgi:phage-related protein
MKLRFLRTVGDQLLTLNDAERAQVTARLQRFADHPELLDEKGRRVETTPEAWVVQLEDGSRALLRFEDGDLMVMAVVSEESLRAYSA